MEHLSFISTFCIVKKNFLTTPLSAGSKALQILLHLNKRLHHAWCDFLFFVFLSKSFVAKSTPTWFTLAYSKIILATATCPFSGSNTPFLWEWKAVSLIVTCRFSFCESYGIEKAQKKASQRWGWEAGIIVNLQLIIWQVFHLFLFVYGKTDAYCDDPV